MFLLSTFIFFKEKGLLHLYLKWKMSISWSKFSFLEVNGVHGVSSSKISIHSLA